SGALPAFRLRLGIAQRGEPLLHRVRHAAEAPAHARVLLDPLVEVRVDGHADLDLVPVVRALRAGRHVAPEATRRYKGGCAKVLPCAAWCDKAPGYAGGRSLGEAALILR